MTWQRFDARNSGTKPDVLHRTFRQDTSGYPRITIALYRDYMTLDGVKIAVNSKPSVDGWWQEVNLPDELVGQLIEMLQEYQVVKS